MPGEVRVSSLQVVVAISRREFCPHSSGKVEGGKGMNQFYLLWG